MAIAICMIIYDMTNIYATLSQVVIIGRHI